jgi:hypothetical protein
MIEYGHVILRDAVLAVYFINCAVKIMMIDMNTARHEHYFPISHDEAKVLLPSDSRAENTNSGPDLFYDRFIALLRGQDASKIDLMDLALEVISTLPKTSHAETNSDMSQVVAEFIEEIWSEAPSAPAPEKLIFQPDAMMGHAISDAAFHDDMILTDATPDMDNAQATRAAPGAATVPCAEHKPPADASRQAANVEASDPLAGPESDIGTSPVNAPEETHEPTHHSDEASALTTDDLLMMLFRDVNVRNGDDMALYDETNEEGFDVEEDDFYSLKQAA